MGYWLAAHPTLRLVSLPPFSGWLEAFRHVAHDSLRKLLPWQPAQSGRSAAPPPRSSASFQGG